MATEQEHFENARKWQAEFDVTRQDLGPRASAPVLGQRSDDYVRESFRTMKRTFLPQNHDVYKMNMRGLPNDALVPTWQTLLKPAIQKEAFNPAHVPKGEIREIIRTNSAGQKIHHFVGKDNFCKFMGRPGRRVVGFRTDQGYMNRNGQFVR